MSFRSTPPTIEEAKAAAKAAMEATGVQAEPKAVVYEVTDVTPKGYGVQA